jgi:hypothetical protein
MYFTRTHVIESYTCVSTANFFFHFISTTTSFLSILQIIEVDSEPTTILSAFNDASMEVSGLSSLQ